MATSANKIESNRANAQHSTGPVTPEGKAAVARNAVKHGFTSKHFVVREDEREEFAEVRSELLDQLKPEGALEFISFGQLLRGAWTLRLIDRLEAEAFNGTLESFNDPQTAATLERLARYRAQAQRAYTRAFNELKFLQSNRVQRDDQMREEVNQATPVLATSRDWTKQSQQLAQTIAAEKWEEGWQRIKPTVAERTARLWERVNAPDPEFDKLLKDCGLNAERL
jgi:hypothetical protein